MTHMHIELDYCGSIVLGEVQLLYRQFMYALLVMTHGQWPPVMECFALRWVLEVLVLQMWRGVRCVISTCIIDSWEGLLQLQQVCFPLGATPSTLRTHPAE